MPKSIKPRASKGHLKITIPIVRSTKKLYEKYWTEKWTPRSKNGMSLRYYDFKKHYFDTAQEAAAEAEKLRAYHIRYFAIFKVKKDDKEVFTFVSTDCNGAILRPGDLVGLHIVEYIERVPDLGVSI